MLGGSMSYIVLACWWHSDLWTSLDMINEVMCLIWQFFDIKDPGEAVVILNIMLIKGENGIIWHNLIIWRKCWVILAIKITNCLQHHMILVCSFKRTGELVETNWDIHRSLGRSCIFLVLQGLTYIFISSYWTSLLGDDH